MSARRARLDRLIRAARKASPALAAASGAPGAAEPGAPLGFASRVAARWAVEGRASSPAGMFERAAWWGLATATALCCAALVFTRVGPGPDAFDEWMTAPASGVELFSVMGRIQNLRIALLLAGIFAAGLITGRLTAPRAPVVFTTKSGRLQTAEGALAKLTQTVHLDADQQRRLRPVMEEAAEEMAGLPPVSRERLAAFQDVMRRVREHLRPDQFPAFDRFVERSEGRFERLIRRREARRP